MEGRWRGSAREDGAGGEVAEGGGEAIVKVVVWDAPRRGEVAMAGVMFAYGCRYLREYFARGVVVTAFAECCVCCRGGVMNVGG